MDSFAVINGTHYDLDSFADLMVDLVTQAMDCADTRGTHSELGLTYHWMEAEGFLP